VEAGHSIYQHHITPSYAYRGEHLAEVATSHLQLPVNLSVQPQKLTQCIKMFRPNLPCCAIVYGDQGGRYYACGHAAAIEQNYMYGRLHFLADDVQVNFSRLHGKNFQGTVLKQSWHSFRSAGQAVLTPRIGSPGAIQGQQTGYRALYSVIGRQLPCSCCRCHAPIVSACFDPKQGMCAGDVAQADSAE
jgi:hypothetical protein